MPVPTIISELSTTAASNSPDGAIDVPSSLDNYQRAHASFIAQLRDEKAALAGPAFTGIPAAPTAAAATNTTQLATTAFALNEAALRYGKNNILGTVSQTAGVPTGAVIERGSNVNGEYVRFADGTQICTLTLALSSVVVGTATGGNFISGAFTGIAFASAFVSPPVVSISPIMSNGIVWATLAGNSSTTGPGAFYLMSPSSSTVSGSVPIVAIGRWF